MKQIKFFLLVILFLILTPVFADEIIDENLLFREQDEPVVATASLENASSVDNYFEKESTSFTGAFTSKGNYAINRAWLENSGAFSNNRLNAFSYVNLLLDIRFKQNYKTFLNLQANSVSTTATTSNLNYSIKEMFMDINFNKAVYFRAGKQVLQWSRTYFWNPSDVINIQKRDFANMSEYREGVYGLKMHIPLGTAYNYYAFADFSNARNLDEVGVAGKAEFLVGGSEIGLSAWKKKGFCPVFASDISTKLAGLDLLGEAAFSYGENTSRVKYVSGIPTIYKISDTWVSKISLGLSKSFAWEYADRITLIGELFYNDSGYINNIFADAGLLSTLLANNLYEPNYYAKYYGAVFLTISKFPLLDMTTNLNLLMNLADNSSILATGITYSPVNNVVLGMTVYNYFGPAIGEYTYSGNRMSLELSSTMSF